MRRVYTKGIRMADKCMLMAAVAYNLKKLLKRHTNKTRIIIKGKIKELINELKETIVCLGILWHVIKCNRLNFKKPSTIKSATSF